MSRFCCENIASLRRHPFCGSAVSAPRSALDAPAWFVRPHILPLFSRPPLESRACFSSSGIARKAAGIDAPFFDFRTMPCFLRHLATCTTSEIAQCRLAVGEGTIWLALALGHTLTCIHVNRRSPQVWLGSPTLALTCRAHLSSAIMCPQQMPAQIGRAMGRRGARYIRRKIYFRWCIRSARTRALSA